MCVSKASLTVYFDSPFWVGLYQLEDENGYWVCKITFGGEPKDLEVLDWLLQHWRNLNFSPPVAGGREINRPLNPKRMRRTARKATQTTGTGTKAQQALQLQREQQKTQRKAGSKERRKAEQERKLALQQEKRRQKHRGH